MLLKKLLISYIMVTTRKKIRHRKQLFAKIALFTALFLVVVCVAYLISLKLFSKSGYVSPLSKIMPVDTSYKQDKDIEAIKSGLAAQKIEISSVKQSGSSYVIILKDKSQVIFSSQKDINSQISSLQFILSRLTMEGKLFTQLDLRFDKPVITLRK